MGGICELVESIVVICEEIGDDDDDDEKKFGQTFTLKNEEKKNIKMANRIGLFVNIV